MKKKTVIVVDTRCYQCGMSSTDTFLERVKGTDLYVCEYCSPPSASELYKSEDEENPEDGETEDDSDSGMIGGGFGSSKSGSGRRGSDYDGYGDDDY
jgi:hypothetical protein